MRTLPSPLARLSASAGSRKKLWVKARWTLVVLVVLALVSLSNLALRNAVARSSFRAEQRGGVITRVKLALPDLARSGSNLSPGQVIKDPVKELLKAAKQLRKRNARRVLSVCP